MTEARAPASVTSSSGPVLTLAKLRRALNAIPRLPWQGIDAELRLSTWLPDGTAYVVLDVSEFIKRPLVVMRPSVREWIAQQSDGPFPLQDAEVAAMCVYRARQERAVKKLFPIMRNQQDLFLRGDFS